MAVLPIGYIKRTLVTPKPLVLSSQGDDEYMGTMSSKRYCWNIAQNTIITLTLTVSFFLHLFYIYLEHSFSMFFLLRLIKKMSNG